MNFSYEDNITSRLYQEYSARLHRLRLEKIKNRKIKSLTSSSPDQKSKKRNHGFSQLPNTKEIIRQNKILYDRLTIISERKTYPENNIHVAKTLNYAYRRKQTQKIIKENQEFIQRLIEKPSQISMKKLELDYEYSLKYKDNISKKKISDRIEKIVKSHGMPMLEEVSFKRESSLDTKKHKKLSLDCKPSKEIEKIDDEEKARVSPNQSFKESRDFNTKSESFDDAAGDSN
jgi:Hemingway/CFA97